jgi:hypothetical protein
VKTYFETKDFVQALKLGVIAGSATAYSDRIASPALIKQLMSFSQTIEISVIENE